MSFIYDWVEERLEIQAISDDILSKFVPAHVNIYYCFGGIVLTSFLFQAASGFSLTLYYRPTVIEAYASIKYILYAVHLGWVVRSIHRWSSGVLVMVLILHLCRVYLTSGFKKPREFIWVSGLLLALVSVSFGVTGYSLPWDTTGYWASKIVTAVPEALDSLVLGLGQLVVVSLRGGFSVSQATLTRFYVLHTFVLPNLTLVLLMNHLPSRLEQVLSYNSYSLEDLGLNS